MGIIGQCTLTDRRLLATPALGDTGCYAVRRVLVCCLWDHGAMFGTTVQLLGSGSPWCCSRNATDQCFATVHDYPGVGVPPRTDHPQDRPWSTQYCCGDCGTHRAETH